MADGIQGQELIGIAIGVEQRGIAFYDVIARSADDAGAGRVFQHLANMERQHIQVFQEMLGHSDERDILVVARAEQPYLESLLASSVFSDDLATSEMATRVSSDLEALDLAIVAEKDSILLYYQLHEMMAASTHAALDRVMAEEKKHLGQLTEIKKELAKHKSG